MQNMKSIKSILKDNIKYSMFLVNDNYLIAIDGEIKYSFNSFDKANEYFDDLFSIYKVRGENVNR